jgi:hypothetical protein
VIGQVAPAGAGRAPGAQGVGAQGSAELGGVVGRGDVAARRGAPELRVAPEDLARGDGCGEEGTHCQDERTRDPEPLLGGDLCGSGMQATAPLGQSQSHLRRLVTVFLQATGKGGTCPVWPSGFFCRACHDQEWPGTK